MTDYSLLCEQIKALSEISPDYIPLLSNASALINESLSDINWAGFYLVKNETLILGPFQGKTACVIIPKGKGVCGTSFAEDATQLVKDVHQFKGHIACDSASNSEIVVPVHSGSEVKAVLDIDSPSFARFTEEDKTGLELFVKTLEDVITW